jgi:hypothetical protein
MDIAYSNLCSIHKGLYSVGMAEMWLNVVPWNTYSIVFDNPELSVPV